MILECSVTLLMSESEYLPMQIAYFDLGYRWKIFFRGGVSLSNTCQLSFEVCWLSFEAYLVGELSSRD